MSKKITESEILIHLQTLSETPRRLHACTDGLDDQRLRAAPPDEWSPVEIMGHLRACAEIWSFSICAMLTLDSPELGHVHPRDWVKKLGYASLGFAENLEALEVGRKNLLRLLQPLTLDAWGRSARFVGMRNVHTIFDETYRMATHEAGHCEQIEQLLIAR